MRDGFSHHHRAPGWKQGKDLDSLIVGGYRKSVSSRMLLAPASVPIKAVCICYRGTGLYIQTADDVLDGNFDPGEMLAKTVEGRVSTLTSCHWWLRGSLDTPPRCWAHA